MFSPRDSDVVLDEVGDKFLGALVRATGGARRDLASMREWHPDWFVGMFEREVAGIIHTRLWSHLERELDGSDEVTLHSREPRREISVQTPLGRRYVMRVKRHSRNDRISSYSTLSDVQFWSGPTQAQTFDDMEAVSLAVGYRWERETRTIGDVVVSYREGKENVVWAYEVAEGAVGSAVPMVYTPILPTLPTIDLRGASEDKGAEVVETP